MRGADYLFFTLYLHCRRTSGSVTIQYSLIREVSSYHLKKTRGNINLTFDMMDETKVNIDQQPPPYPYPQQQPPHMAQYGQMQMVPVVMAPRFGKSPEVRTCINCRAEVMTTVKRSLSQNGWIWSLVLWYSIHQLHLIFKSAYGVGHKYSIVYPKI